MARKPTIHEDGIIDLRRSQMTPEMQAVFDKSPALAIAQKYLAEGLQPPSDLNYDVPSLRRQRELEEPSLADQFIAETYKTHQATTNDGHSRKRIEDAMMQYRILMRKAHRFVLDNEFTEMATRAMHVPAEKILARLQFATLPYETTWIEFDLHTKVRTIRELHKVNDPDMSEVGQRMGYLIQRIDDTTAVATLVSGTDRGAEVHLLAHFFSTVERDKWPKHGAIAPGGLHGAVEVLGEDLAEEAEMEQTIDHVDGGMWGYTEKPGGRVGMRETGTQQEMFSDLRTPAFLRRHGATGVGPLFAIYSEMLTRRHMRDTQEEGYQKMANLVLSEVTEFAGHMRWLVTVLAMLNEIPMHADHVVPSHQQRVSRTKKVTFTDYHKVTLRLPKIRPVPFIERHINGDVARRHRAHEVRAHWRTYLHEKHCRREEHAWEYDHENGYALCGNCFAFRRMIHEHIRGDEKLGWTRKDYVIKKESGL